MLDVEIKARLIRIRTGLLTVAADVAIPSSLSVAEPEPGLGLEVAPERSRICHSQICRHPIMCMSHKRWHAEEVAADRGSLQVSRPGHEASSVQEPQQPRQLLARPAHLHLHHASCVRAVAFCPGTAKHRMEVAGAASEYQRPSTVEGSRRHLSTIFIHAQKLKAAAQLPRVVGPQQILGQRARPLARAPARREPLPKASHVMQAPGQCQF
mmetsp:Transcript_111257/g.202332  ORF Transcript_111257/g.202332 Transcript_111257/m.202332 type:complete len:211 (+) Transcript_111257:379-1011(+)